VVNTDSAGLGPESSEPSSEGTHLLWILLAVLGVIVLGGTLVWLFQEARKARTAARMSTSRNHLKQIGLALHNYHFTHSTLPASATVDDKGLAYQSWMYAIIPFIDKNPLSQQIDDNRPWNDKVNRPYTQRVLPIYLNPGIGVEQNAGGFGLTHYAANSRLFEPNRFLTFQQITDGLETTLMVGEVNDGFQPWAKPGNTRDPALGFHNRPDTFGSPFPGGVHFLFGDGRVKFLSDDIDPAVLKALATPDGGEQIDAAQILQAPSPID